MALWARRNYKNDSRYKKVKNGIEWVGLDFFERFKILTHFHVVGEVDPWATRTMGESPGYNYSV